ncbi:MAG: hypothetical protein J6Y45_00650, partial [Bacteroidales bacterium]|nr:hypothetical protein [Bacteroidales bacterium]
MKRILYLLLITAFALAGCRQEPKPTPVPEDEGIKLTLKIPSTTLKGSWLTGDKALINGIESPAVAEDAAGKNEVTFEFEELTKPYFAGFPASAFSGFADSVATLTLPAGAFIAKGESASLTLDPVVSILQIKVSGENLPALQSVAISAGDKALGGAFSTDFKSITPTPQALKVLTEELDESFTSGSEVFFMIPAGDYSEGGIEVTLTDATGKTSSQTIEPEAAFVAGRKYAFELTYGEDTPQPIEEYNIFGKVTCAGAGGPGVLVSDGVEIAQTDANGEYQLISQKEWKYVFMTIPTVHEAPLDGIQPEFWKELEDDDVETVEEVNFELI